MPEKFDEIDLKILASLQKDSRKSVTQIARETRVSRPTVAGRLEKLAENKLVDFSIGMDTMALGFKLALVTFEMNDTKDKQEIKSKIIQCPRVLQMLDFVDKPGYTLLVYSENTETLLSAIECFKSIVGNANLSWQRVKQNHGEKTPIKIFSTKCEITPCGKKCGVCSSYVQQECLGCPATNEYKGPL